MKDVLEDITKHKRKFTRDEKIKIAFVLIYSTLISVGFVNLIGLLATH